MASSETTRAAFESVALPLMKTLYNRALSLSHRDDVAADLVQETYLRAFRTFGNFEAGTNAKAWLLSILYSVFVTRYRKQKREVETVALDDAEVVAVDETSDPRVLDPHLWASEPVHAALQQLPEAFRTLVLMIEVDGLTYEEAAATLQCPVGTVRSRLSRARRVLYNELLQYAQRHGFGKAER